MSQRREFLQIAKTFRPNLDNITGWYVSEMLEGSRCLWDGGLSRGVATEQVPWAAITNPRTGEPKAKIRTIATGLWSQHGNPIIAPEWFLAKLPPIPCDGMLWAGRGNLAECRSICAGDKPDSRFVNMHFAIFSAPPVEYLFQTGLVKTQGMLVQIDFQEVDKWVKTYANQIELRALPRGSNLSQELFTLDGWTGWDEQVYPTPNSILSKDRDEALEQLDQYANQVISKGGKGVIIRDPQARWKPKKVSTCLKYRPKRLEENENPE